jgi:hypothetical protein
MLGEFFETERRSFKPAPMPALSKEAREAVNSALQALSTWRNETADTNEKNGRQVIRKMASAAIALGWPPQIVDAARTQIQSIIETQIKAMDNIMDAWEEQLKLPSPMTASPSALLSRFNALPSSTGTWPGTAALQKGDMNPLQFWMQLAEQWQKSWADSMTYWGTIGKPH